MAYADDPAAYEALLEDIVTGARLHYDTHTSADPDFDLLSGDQRYADGLVKLAGLGDLDATKVLGDAISAIARAQAAGDPEAARRAWHGAVAAIRGTA